MTDRSFGECDLTYFSIIRTSGCAEWAVALQFSQHHHGQFNRFEDRVFELRAWFDLFPPQTYRSNDAGGDQQRSPFPIFRHERIIGE
jgi:hypothetical protein